MRFRKIVLCGLLLTAPLAIPGAHAQAECAGFARTDLERLYCQINATAPGIVPGTLGEFRKNPPRTQRLLLQRPATRLGLRLPDAPPASARPNASSEDPPQGQLSNPSRGLSSNPRGLAPNSQGLAPNPHGQSSQPPQSPATASPATPGAAASLEDCRLQARSIVCGGRRYQRLTNLPNQRLAQGALGPDNRLQLGPATAPEDLYLEQSYREYVDRMVSIGLAGVTMSYTKFHHFYAEAARSGTSFPERMAAMFEYLKKDKQTLAVDSRGDKAGPAALSACYRLDDEYIICDDVSTNWIYRAQ